MAPLLPSLLAVPLYAADAATPAIAPVPPQPPPAASGPTVLDGVTQRRAEQVADDYLAQQQALKVALDPQSLLDLANAEVLLLEAKTYLDQHQPAKAGADYVAAGDKLHDIKSDQRPLLGKRLRQAEDQLTALSLALLKSDAVDPAAGHLPAPANQDAGTPQGAAAATGPANGPTAAPAAAEPAQAPATAPATAGVPVPPADPAPGTTSATPAAPVAPADR
jgi:hypothetical protein